MAFLLSEPDTCALLCISAQLPMPPIIKHCWQICQHTECRNQTRTAHLCQTQTLLRTCIHSLTSTNIKGEWPLGIKTGCTLKLRLRSKAELVFHASRRKLGWAGRREVRDSLHVLSRIRNESPIDEHFSGKDTQWAAVDELVTPHLWAGSCRSLTHTQHRLVLDPVQPAHSQTRAAYPAHHRDVAISREREWESTVHSESLLWLFIKILSCKWKFK